MYSISNTQEKAKEVVEAAIEAAKYVEELCTTVIIVSATEFILIFLCSM